MNSLPLWQIYSVILARDLAALSPMGVPMMYPNTPTMEAGTTRRGSKDEAIELAVEAPPIHTLEAIITVSASS